MYIKENLYYLFDFKLDPNKYNVGFNYEDSLLDKFVELNNDQINFKKEYPEASVKEVWNTKLESNPNLMLDKRDLILEAQNYGNSSKVKNFKINNENYWISSEQRALLFHTFTLCKNNNKDTVTWWIGNHKFEINVITAIDILLLLEFYSYQCFLIKCFHMNEINKLTTNEALHKYDFTKDYPPILKFDIK